MRTCDSVIQNCVVGGRHSTESSGERYTLSPIPLYGDGTCPETRKDGRSVLACAKSDPNRKPSRSSLISGSLLL